MKNLKILSTKDIHFPPGAHTALQVQQVRQGPAGGREGGPGSGGGRQAACGDERGGQRVQDLVRFFLDFSLFKTWSVFSL